jgi:hypothetical protein
MPSGSTYGQQVLIRASYIKNNIASSTNLLSYLDNTGGDRYYEISEKNSEFECGGYLDIRNSSELSGLMYS